MNAEIISKKQTLKSITDSLDIATKPNLELTIFKFTSEKKIGIYLQNNGTGIAYLKHINFYYNNQSYIEQGNKATHLRNLMSDIGINEEWVLWENEELSDTMGQGGSLAHNQGYFILRVSPSLYTDRNAYQFIQAIQGVKIEIEYYSSKGVVSKLVKTIENY